MPLINEIDLKKQIKNRMFQRVYFIFGEDSFLKHHYVNELCDKAVGNILPDLNFVKIEGKGLKMQTLSDEVEQLPVMAEKRCVLVVDYDIASKGENEKEDLKQIITGLPETTVLVFFADTIEIDYKKPEKWRSFITLINKEGATVDFAHKDNAALVKILMDSAAKRKVNMDISVARYMLEVCGNDMQNLQTELDKLCSYKRLGNITKEDIDKLASKTLDATVWQLPKAVLSGNTDLALKTVSELIALRLDPIAIAAALIGAYVDAYRVKCALNSGKKATDIADDFGYKKTQFRLTNSVGFANKMSVLALRKSLDVLDDADTKLKSSSLDGRTVLERAVILLIEIIRQEQR